MPHTAPYAPYTPDEVTLDDGTVQHVPDHMSLAQFEAFPWPENSRWELIKEVPVLSPSPLPLHQMTLTALRRFIEDVLSEKPDLLLLPTIDVALEPARSWVIPDLVVVREQDIDMLARPFRANVLLAVEILSPSTASLDVGPKRDAYAEAGAAEYWTADPQTGAISVYVDPDGRDYNAVAVDEDGFVTSPLLGKTFRVARMGSRFKVLRR